jgi:glycosyltransferase involved in cell wall biosynthesis
MIDVFICTYNPEEIFLKRTVDGILSQTLDKSKWTITIIDNNSKFPVADFEFLKSLNIKVIVESKQGLTAARGCAVKNASAEILVFVDDDNILEKDYLKCVQDAFNDEQIAILSGAIYPEYLKEPQQWFYVFEEMLAIRKIKGNELIINKKSVFNGLFPIGAGMAVRKNVMEEYYNDHLKEENYIEGRKGNDLSSGEDLDLDFYALNRGYKIGVNPLMQLTHIIPANRITFKYIKKLTSSSMRSSCLLNKKWSKVFGHNVYEIFDMTKSQLLIRLIWNRFSGFINKQKYIRYLVLKTILTVK